jgi:hypothetical protein
LIGAGSRSQPPQREMGPTLRSTPLSPARGPRRVLDARRFQCRIRQALASMKVGFVIARRSRRCRFRRGPGLARRSFPTARRFRDRCRRPGSQTALALPGGSANSSTPSRQMRPFRLCALVASTVWDLDCTRTNLCAFRFSSLHHAALAIVSLRFQNPFFLAGLSAFVLEGPIPVSMI